MLRRVKWGCLSVRPHHLKSHTLTENKKTKPSVRPRKMKVLPRRNGNTKNFSKPPPKVLKASPAKQNPTVKRTGWQKFIDGLKKALSWGKDIAEIAIPLLGDVNGTSPSIVSCSRNGRRCSVPRTAMVGLSNPLNIPGSGHPIIRTTSKGYSIVHSGLLGNVSIPADTSRGDMIFRIDLSPIVIEEWLSKMSNFEKYRFKHIIVSYKPTCAATEAGTICGFFEWDVDDPLTLDQDEETVRAAMAHESAEMSSVWNPFMLHFTNGEEPDEEWYIDPSGNEPRFTTQGMFTIIAGSDFPDALEAGTLTVAYEIEFLIPELRSLNSGTWAAYAGVANTSSSAPFGSKISSLVVEYPDPISGDQVVPQNTSIRYFNDGGEPADAIFQIPRGYWEMSFSIVGTTLSTIATAFLGDYALLKCITGDVETKYNTAALGSGYALFYSSGMDTARSTSDIPTDGFKIYFASVATITSSRLIVTALNGMPKYSLPLQISEAVHKLINRLDLLESKLSADEPNKTLPDEKKSPPLTSQDIEDLGYILERRKIVPKF